MFPLFLGGFLYFFGGFFSFSPSSFSFFLFFFLLYLLLFFLLFSFFLPFGKIGIDILHSNEPHVNGHRPLRTTPHHSLHSPSVVDWPWLVVDHSGRPQWWW
ncbi:hypothetical protein BZA05DRAFT_397541 [Tricharina praecox]|uniref:uncharacterized protein n=1 Tax=Tricharina praecox TaxID=43433 RepID=UPI0022204A69|nr:uncharacterized protein BZA05DRAFT_397541 [Tricharina praecox]KAI5852321.1 hypothetical protein BZA05DRAFT_397541 [Tricharina praecox]